MDYGHLARAIERATGTPWAAGGALGVVLAWAVAGPFVGFSEGWQLVINTGTTITTFLMVFLIQSTQSRDTRALHLKLDELLSAVGPARTELALAEEMSETDLDQKLGELRQRASEQ